MPPSFCPNLQHTAAAAAAAAAADRGAGSADRPVNECMPRGASSQADWLALGRQGGGKSQERGEGGAEMGEGGEERQVEGRREKRALNAVELSCEGSPDGRKPSNESSPAVRTPCKESSPGGSQRSRSSSQREHQHQHNHPQQRQLEQGEERHGNSKKMRVKVFKEGTLIARTVYLSLFSDFPSLSAHIAAMFGPALKAGRGGAGQGHDMVADGSPGKAGTAGAVAAGAAATGAGQREGADASAAAGAASGDAAGGAAASDAAGAGSAAGAAAGAGSAAGAGAAAGGGSAGGSAGGSDAGASDAGDATDLLAGWHFVYEDSDGDTLLVGDGTWSDFCKHARVLRLVRDE
ncbi:hypothetical protein CLOP_g2114 [Closterium sp. NIES-67]|nr:hypothetical protein CLOP_g2114 [Closterium sp. NIES-67]